MTGIARNLRAALDAQYDRELALMRERYPWIRHYQILPPVRGYHAIHTASGALLGPARNITALGDIILADHQGRPLRPHPVPYPVPGCAEDDDRTQFGLRVAPYLGGDAS